jgi:hypothetical protein
MDVNFISNGFLKATSTRQTSWSNSLVHFNKGNKNDLNDISKIV